MPVASCRPGFLKNCQSGQHNVRKNCQKDKPTTPGCLKSRSLFFIPSRSNFFKENTWAQLYERYEMNPKDVHNNKNLKFLGYIDSKIVDEIIDCLFIAQEDDLPPIHRKLLKPPLFDSLLKLKEKFNT